jgi:peptidoglycan hydrolase-like protein with peptidoglycan-binding domain
MKRLLLASAACWALSLPAMAANAVNQPAPPPKTQTQQQSQAATQPSQPANQQRSQAINSSPQSANQQQAKVIEPSKLSKEQIREIQMNLNKKGFSSGHVDGIWGRDTTEAVMNFQKAKNLPGKGELNNQTLSDLGVNLNNQAQATGSMSRGQAQSKTNSSSAQNNMKNQNGSKAKTP